MPLPMLDWAWAMKNRRAPRAFRAAPRARTASGLRRAKADRDACELRPAHEVEQQERADHDLDVADAEDVVDRQPRRGVEDVAEEAQRGVARRGGVREVAGLLGDAG